MSNRFSFGDRTERWSPTLALVGAGFFVVALLAWLVGGSPEGHRFLPFVQIAFVAGLACLLGALALRPSLWMHAIGIRQVRYGLNTLVMAIAFLAIVLLINVAAKQPSLSREWDLTEEQELTLTQGTVDTVQQLKEPVHILGLYVVSTQRSTQDQVETLLKRYQQVNPDKVTYEFLDPYGSAGGLVAAQSFLGKYQIAPADMGLYVLQGDRRQKVDGTDEKSLTLAIYRLSTTKQTVYFLQGHGELTQQGLTTAVNSLDTLGYSVRSTVITGTAVPTDTSILIIAQPLANLKQNEVDALRTYLSGGGSVMLLVDPDLFLAEPFGGPLDDYLRAGWGITVSRDLVIDNETLAAANLAPLGTGLFNYPAHQITSGIRLPSILMDVRSIALGKTFPEGVSVAPILKTETATAAGAIYGETDLALLKSQQKYQYDAGVDIPSPLTVGVAATRAISGTSTFGRLIVIGSSSLINDSVPPQGVSLLGQSSLGNKSIWENSLTWLLTDRQSAGSPPNIDKSPTTRSLDLTKATQASEQWVGLSSACVVPGVVLLAGVIVFVARRRQR